MISLTSQLTNAEAVHTCLCASLQNTPTHLKSVAWLVDLSLIVKW